MKRTLFTEEKSKIMYEILTYMTEHPDSSDTLEGIIQWWLLERKIKRHISKVEKALSELVAKGFILEHKGKDSHSYYRLNKSKHTDLKTLLKQAQEDT